MQKEEIANVQQDDDKQNLDNALKVLNRQVILILLILIIFQKHYSATIVFVFYPTLAKQNQLDIKDIGLVFAMLNITAIISFLTIGKMMKFWGRKFIMLLTLFLLSLASLFLGLLYYIQNQQLFFIASILTRLIQGISFGVATVAYAYLPIIFPDTYQKKIIILEISRGIGMMLGPLIGSALYSIEGYQLVFYFGSGFILIFIPILSINLPSDKIINQIYINTNKKQIQSNPLSILKLLKNLKFLLTFLLLVFGAVGQTFSLTNLSLQLNEYGIQEKHKGLLFIIPQLSYQFNMMIVNKVPKYVDRKVLLLIGLVIIVTSLLFIGTENLLYIPDNIYMVVVGLILIGFGQNLIIVPFLPELIYQGCKVYEKDEEKEQVGDISSGFFQTALSLAYIIGPYLGGILISKIGFRGATNVLELIIASYILIYFIFCDGVQAFKSLFYKNESEVQQDIQQNGPYTQI